MKRLLPRADIENWGGADIDGNGHCEGWSIAIQWLGLIVEFNVGRVTDRNGGVK